MPGSRALRFLQLGKETTAGTSVPATTIWRGQGSITGDYPVNFPAEDIGIYGGGDRGYIPYIGAKVELDSTPVTFEQFPYILASGVKSVVSGAQDGTAGSGYVYDFPWPTTAANTIKTVTIEGGDDQQEEEMEYAFVTDFKLSGKAKEAWMLTATYVGRQVTASTKTGALSLPTVEEALFQKTSLFIDATSGTMGTTQVASTLIAADINVTTGVMPHWTADGNLYFSTHVQGPQAVTLDITFLHNANAVAEKAAQRAGTSRLIRLQCLGSALTTAATYTNKTLNVDIAGKWQSFDKLGEDSGFDIVKGTFIGRYNATYGKFGDFLVVNQLTTLP